MTEVEKLRKTVASLAGEQSDYERKHAVASQKKVELESRKESLRSQLARGDESARRDLRKADAEMQNVQEDLESFASASREVAQRLETATDSLARAERQAAISALENQITALGPLDNQVEAILSDLKQKSDALFSATKEVAAKLFSMDEKRFDHAFGYNLTALIRAAINHRFEELGFPDTERRPSFMERASGRLRAAVEQLKYEGLQGNIVPKGKEKLYRTRNRISGLRLLELPPGALIALRDEEAAEFVEGGSLELAEKEEAA